MCGWEAAIFLRGEKETDRCPDARVPGILSQRGFTSFQYFFVSTMDMVCLITAVHQHKEPYGAQGKGCLLFPPRCC